VRDGRPRCIAMVEHLTVRVSPATAGTPTDSVTITSKGIAICTITLKSGQGSCALAAQLIVKPIGDPSLLTTTLLTFSDNHAE